MDTSWSIISHKKSKSHNKSKSHIKSLTPKSIYDIIKIITNTLYNIKLFPEYIFLYGSRARKTNRDNSDVDLIVFWKYPVPTIEQLLYVKETLINNLELGVDFVNMHITNKNILVYDERTICYYNNVIQDAICIYKKDNAKNIIIDDLFDVSERIKLLN